MRYRHCALRGAGFADLEQSIAPTRVLMSIAYCFSGRAPGI
jgi:hypothetical protein